MSDNPAAEELAATEAADARLDPVVETLLAYNRALYSPGGAATTLGQWAEAFIEAVQRSSAWPSAPEGHAALVLPGGHWGVIALPPGVTDATIVNGLIVSTSSDDGDEQQQPDPEGLSGATKTAAAKGRGR